MRLQMLPVLPAKATDGSNLQLFLAEGLAEGSTATSSGSPPASTTSTASGEASLSTALIRFNLTDGNMTYAGMDSLTGATDFRGAVRFLPDSQHLSLLLTETLDASSDESLRSALPLQDRARLPAGEYAHPIPWEACGHPRSPRCMNPLAFRVACGAIAL